MPAVCHGGLVVSAGMTPRVNGKLQVRGLVGREVDVDAARAAAALAAGNALAAISALVGGVSHVQRCLRMTVYLAIEDGFEDLSLVADAATAVIAEHLGEAALPVRTTIGVRGLPSDGHQVEIELTAAVVDPLHATPPTPSGTPPADAAANAKEPRTSGCSCSTRYS